jgi:hypothetical protein
MPAPASQNVTLNGIDFTLDSTSVAAPDWSALNISAGIYEEQNDNQDGHPVGTVNSQSPSDVTVTLDPENHTATADVSMQADGGETGGGVHIRSGDPEFGGTSSYTDDLNFASSATKDSITVYTDGHQPAVLRSGSAEFTGGGDVFCEDCSFFTWGGWNSHLVFNDGGQGNSNIFAHGWWIAGDIIDQSDLPFDGSATYEGGAIADVANNLNGEGWVTYTAKGDMVMTWDFGTRDGDLTISNFDTKNIDGGLTFTGHMTTPGQLEGKNQFNGSLSGVDLPENLSDLSGSANGSFVRGPLNFVDGKAVKGSTPQGVIGNWKVGSERYNAAGVFGGAIKPR